MALVQKIEHLALQVNAPHRQVDCTYDVVTDHNGDTYLQLDTYGSANRQILDKKSQSIRLSPAALADLKAIIKKHNL